MIRFLVLALLLAAPAAAQAVLFPGGGDTVSDSRPAIGVAFPRAHQAELTTLSVDGKDFTQAAHRSPREIRWRPALDLESGKHSVVVTSIDRDGESHTYRWSFYVQSESGGPVLSPARGETVNLRRPEIRATFAGPIRQDHMKLTIDGLDFTRFATIKEAEVSMLPPYDLELGGHRVRLEVVDSEDRLNPLEWNFTIGGGEPSGLPNETPAPAPAPDGNWEQQQMMFITTPGRGAAVGPIFKVAGRTAPEAQIRVTALAKGKSYDFSGTSNMVGQFELEIDLTAVPPGTDFKLTLRATVNGNPLQPATMELLRQ